MIECVALKYNPGRAVSHPLGVKPSGNLYMEQDLESLVEFRRHSLGVFSRISEDLLLDIFSFLDASDLLSLSGVSHYCRAFSFHHDLWRDLFWSSKHNSPIDFKSSWRNTVLIKKAGESPRFKKLKSEESSSAFVPVRNVFSDTLFGVYRASALEPTQRWINRENIERVKFNQVSRTEFIERFEAKNKPVIITGFIESEWKDLSREWKTVADIAHSSFPTDPVMECGSVEMRLSEFQSYVESNLWRIDESPIFVFDTKNFSSCHFPPIPILGEDLFDLLEGEYRPDNKWLLIGTEGASSKWHVDPNSTSAWNAVITGAKKWILLSPCLGPPPGVEVSGDGFAVRQPLTLTDWLDGGFYRDMEDKYGEKNPGLVEATCRAGEVMFVPRGWWHCVRNVGDEVTIAITQNYAAEAGVDQVRRFLKEMSHCVSGVPNHVRSKLWMEFDRKLCEKRPDLFSGRLEPDQSADTSNQAESDNESCCGGEVQEFSFWGHFASGNRSLNFER